MTVYGPRLYFGPADEPPEPVIGLCECGQSEEDCAGDCHSYSMLQLVDPVTGERPLSNLPDPDDDDPRIAAIEAERAYWGR